MYANSGEKRVASMSEKKYTVFPSNVIVITDAVWIVLASCEVGVNGRKALLPAIPTLSQMTLPESKVFLP
jgi:hypothetical protein